MAISLLHAFHSPKTDGTDVTLVKPSNWNAEHTIIMDEGIWGRPPGSGPGPPVEIPISSLFATGMMSMWAGTTAPTGWFLCDGQLLSRTTYAALFAIVGTYYGAGDGLATFAVPDMRGRVAAGVDPGIGRLTASTVTNPTLPGGSGGQELVQYYADIGGSCSVNVSVSVSGGTGGNNADLYIQGGNAQFYTVANAGHAHNFSGSGGGSGSGGISGGGYTRSGTNVQPLLMVNYIIKA